jgi:hypothetical protein
MYSIASGCCGVGVGVAVAVFVGTEVGVGDGVFLGVGVAVGIAVGDAEGAEVRGAVGQVVGEGMGVSTSTCAIARVELASSVPLIDAVRPTVWFPPQADRLKRPKITSIHLSMSCFPMALAIALGIDGPSIQR